MKRILSAFAAVIAMVLLFGTFAQLASAAINTSGFAAQVVALSNAERAKVGKAALQFGNKALNDAAMRRATEIAGKFSHTRPNGKEWDTVFAEFGLEGAIGENIAEGFTAPAAVVAGWMDSPGHRANILDEIYTNENGKTKPVCDYNWIGVAVCEGANGKLYWVQLFFGGSLANDDPATTTTTTTTTSTTTTTTTTSTSTSTTTTTAPTTTTTAPTTTTTTPKLLGTNRDSTPLNWILFILGFGWIWMWFV